ncbi:transporter [Tenacibaculum sp. SG-28]|nr:transporter [Tenacibaculum sp. SG-28]
MLSLSTFSQKKWTLKECVDYALENNITVKQNKLNIDLAKKDVEIAEGNFLPNLNASSSGTFSSGLSQDRTGILRNTQNFNSSFGLSGVGSIFNGFRNRNTKNLAELNVKGSELDLNIIENDISLNIVNTYLNVLFAKENLAVARTQAEISTKQIERAKAQFEAGAIPKGDLLNVESTAANDNQNVIIQENTLNIALLRLAQFLQISNEGFDVDTIAIGSPSAALLYDSADEVYTKALTYRPEIGRAMLNVENADLNIELEKGNYLPSLSYSLGAGTSYFHQFNNIIVPNDNFFSQINDRIRYNAGLSLNIPIFNRFQTKNRVAKSRINKMNTELALENQKLQLQQEIEQAFLDAKAAAKTYEAANISLAAQKEAFKNAQVSYNYGTMTQFDFDQVRNRLVNAESTMIRSKYDYIFRTKVLKFYYGESIVD